MRLPVIRAGGEIIEHQGEQAMHSAIAVLEELSQAKGLKDEELNLIGELLSNLLGSLEVKRMQSEGLSRTDALNAFMKRVLGSIDKQN